MIPLAFHLSGRKVLVIGAGRVAEAKWKLLLDEGAVVTVISPEALVSIPDAVTYLPRRYHAGDLDGFVLVIVAVGDNAVNAAVVVEAQQRGIWINVVDNPSLCDFYFTAVHRDGDLVISVSSSGSAPALAQAIRDRIRLLLPRHLGEVAATLRRERDLLHAEGQSTEDFSWRERIEELLTEPKARI